MTYLLVFLLLETTISSKKSQTGFNNLNVIRTRYVTKQKADPKITEVALNPNSD